MEHVFKPMNLSVHDFCYMVNSTLASLGLAGWLRQAAVIFMYVFSMHAHEEIYNITSAWQQVNAIQFCLQARHIVSALVSVVGN